MSETEPEPELPWQTLQLLFKSHPWHGVAIGPRAPALLTAYIEIVPTDTVKYELDKVSGYLKVDRPQEFSNVYPSLYGLIPQTLCGARVAALTAERSGRAEMKGDADPLDICVLTEKAIDHGDILVQALPIGGLRVIDGDEADDKIVAVLEGDAVYAAWSEISQCPRDVVARLEHYFLTYKQRPGARRQRVELGGVYGREEAYEVIRRSREDYAAHYASLAALLARLNAH